MAKRFLFVHRRAPHGTLYAQEALDVALVAGAFDQSVSLAFLDDGVYQLLRGQDTSAIGTKDFAATFGALPDHGVEKIYVERESLLDRGLQEADLLFPVIAISRAQMAQLMESQDIVLSF